MFIVRVMVHDIDSDRLFIKKKFWSYIDELVDEFNNMFFDEEDFDEQEYEEFYEIFTKLNGESQCMKLPKNPFKKAKTE